MVSPSPKALRLLGHHHTVLAPLALVRNLGRLYAPPPPATDHHAGPAGKEAAMATVFENPAELTAAVGQQLGHSEWMEIDQDRINLFADATGDHQWIHVDPEMAKAGPFGAPIAHGYLTLSLVSMMMPQILEVHGVSMGVNYGTDKIRFPAPVPVGSKIRGRGELVKAEEVKGGAVQATIRVTIEIEGKDRPACVVDTISRYYP